MKFIRSVICKIKSIYFTLYKTSGTGKIVFNNYNQKLIINMGKNAHLMITGHLVFSNFFSDNRVTTITLGENSKLIINGDFKIGAGVKILIANNAELKIGGREFLNASGITGNSIIMVRERIEIGKDFICSWNVFISDSDWHQIDNSIETIPVIIQDKVWIANNCNILKGTDLGCGSVVGSFTKTSNKKYTERCLITGERGIVVKENISWNR
jgi:hypothetical protein